MIGRLLSVALRRRHCRRWRTASAAGSFGRCAARWSAFLVATAYPVVYYAHTTNLDISYCFWLLLALYAAIVASESERLAAVDRRSASAAAMALSTKEQGFAFLLPLPFMALAAARTRIDRRGVRCWPAPVLWMIGAGAVDACWSPTTCWSIRSGFVGRIAYLLGHPFGAGLQARLAPVEFALWKGAEGVVYVAASVGRPRRARSGCRCWRWPALGAIAVWRRPRAAVWLLVPAVALYYLSLRGLELITLRYLLPITVVAPILAGGLLALIWACDACAPARWARGRDVALAAARAAQRSRAPSSSTGC